MLFIQTLFHENVNEIDHPFSGQSGIWGPRSGTELRVLMHQDTQRETARAGREQDEGLRCRGARNHFSFGCSAFHLWSPDHYPSLLNLNQAERQQPPKQEMERLEQGSLLGDHLNAGTGDFPGHWPSAWKHAAFQGTLSHTRLAPYQGTGLYVWHPLGYCNTA